MNLALLAGLLLPWFTGTIWLAALRRYQGHAPHAGRLPRLLGYGFFLGYALLYAIIVALDGLLQQVSAGHVLGALALLAIVGVCLLAIAGRLRSDRPNDRQISSRAHARQERVYPVLALVLLVWAAVHVTFSLAETLSLPVLSWDAWLVWMYRAKAWFLSGGLAEITSPANWVNATAVPPYTIEAYGYPRFVSIVGFWVALCLGHWSETLVSLPGFLCALAIGLTVFGHMARLGMRPIYPVALTYLLFSTPLFEVHASLGGYADIWMAGYAGLGFVALLSGLIRREPGYLALGFLLLTFSLFVKHEGIVWLLAGIGLAACMLLPARMLWVAASLAAGALALAAISGVHFVDLPFLGAAGISDGRLHVPLVGSFAIQIQSLWGEYAENFFALGSWHLLWPMVLVALALAVSGAGQRSNRAVAGFLLLFITTQLVIFGLSEQGEWAASFTAINRLPLHMLPALIVAMAWVLEQRLGTQLARQDSERPWLAPPLALALTAVGALAYLAQGFDLDQRQPVHADLDFVVGSGSRTPATLTVESYERGFALISSGATNVVAEDYPYLRIDLNAGRVGDPELAPAFFWRRAGQTNTVSRMTLSGSDLYDLTLNEDWHGHIVEFGLLLPDAGQAAPQLHSIALEGATLANRWAWTLRGWLKFEPWSLRSVNFLWGGEARQALRLPVLAAVWAGLTVLLLAAPGFRPRGRPTATTALVLLAGWMLLDARWTLNGARHFADTLERGMLQPDSELLRAAPDSKVYAFIQQFQQKRLAEKPRRIVVVGDYDEYGYFMERAKYHLLPDSVLVTWELDERFSPGNLDYVLFIGDFGGASWAQIWQELPVSERWREAIELSDAGEMAILFSTLK